MNYYRIQFTVSTKIRGNDSFIKHTNPLIPENGVPSYEVKNFIGNFEDQKITTTPYLVNMELFKSARILDLLMTSGGISRKLVISTKLKTILEAFNKNDLQFFNISVKKGLEVYTNYWVLHVHAYKQNFINYENINVVYYKHKADFSKTYESETLNLTLKSIDEFNAHMNNKKPEEISYIEPVQIKKDCTEDFFCLKNVIGGLGYYVSEKLKNVIEREECTGIEFQPIEFRLTEWLQGGEREKIYGKT
jgi:hypothetical protein